MLHRHPGRQPVATFLQDGEGTRHNNIVANLLASYRRSRRGVVQQSRSMCDMAGRFKINCFLLKCLDELVLPFTVCVFFWLFLPSELYICKWGQCLKVHYGCMYNMIFIWLLKTCQLSICQKIHF